MQFKSFFVALWFVGSVVFADTFKAPQYQGYITDQARVLTQSQKQQLSHYSKQIQQLTGAQVATAIISDIGDDWEVDDYANRLFEFWGIGDKKTDKGVLFLVALKQRKMRIEVGYGLEGVLPDGKSGELLDTYVVPYFKQGDVQKGVLNGHLAIVSVIADGFDVSLNAPVSRSQQASRQKRPLTAAESLLAMLVIAGLVVGMIVSPGFRKVVFYMILMSMMSGRGGRSNGHFGGGGGFGGFGGGMSGGGGSSRGW